MVIELFLTACASDGLFGINQNFIHNTSAFAAVALQINNQVNQVLAWVSVVDSFIYVENRSHYQ